MYKYTHSLLPDIFSDFYTFNSTVHDHNTRQSNLLHVPVARTDMRARTVRFKGVSTLNYFSTVVDKNVSIFIYKKKLKQHILAADMSLLVSR